MLTVKNLRVRSLSVDFHDILWELEPTREDVLDYTFEVLRSEGPSGPWESVSPEMEDRFFFVDNRINVTNKWRQYHYLIRVKNKTTGEQEDFGPASHAAEPDLIAAELRKNANLLLREFVGRRCWILPKRTFGQRCKACFNATLKERTKSKCLSCFDTSFLRGYHAPIETFIQFDPSPKRNQQTTVGVLQQTNTTARLGHFPPLKPEDVLIEPENRRWRVVQVNATERLRAIVHQEISVHEIPRSDIEYSINIDLGTGTVKTPEGDKIEPITIKNVTTAGSRNFSNPHSLESFEDEEMPSIFDLHRTNRP